MSDEENTSEKVRILAVDHEDKKAIIENEEGDIGMIVNHEDGQPLSDGAHLVTCSPTDEPSVMEMTTIYKNTSSSKGPAKVNSRAYRDNWDSIFGKKRTQKKEYLN